MGIRSDALLKPNQRPGTSRGYSVDDGALASGCEALLHREISLVDVETLESSSSFQPHYYHSFLSIYITVR